MKICYCCGQKKELSFFNSDKSRKDGLYPNCRPCANKYLRDLRKNNPELRQRLIARSAEYKLKFPEKYKQSIRNSTLKKKYGITLDEYWKLFKKQDSCCAICSRKESNGSGLFHVDHDHKTGKVRGILCQPCNTTLGKVQEKEEILFGLIQYLRSHASVS